MTKDMNEKRKRKVRQKKRRIIVRRNEKGETCDTNLIYFSSSAYSYQGSVTP
jgi:hypothetical protein